MHLHFTQTHQLVPIKSTQVLLDDHEPEGVCVFTMFVCSQCLCVHNVHVFAMFVCSKYLCVHNVHVFAMFVCSHCLCVHNVCVFKNVRVCIMFVCLQ